MPEPTPPPEQSRPSVPTEPAEPASREKTGSASGASDLGSAEPTELAPTKSRYASFAENTTMRSVTWALVITVVLVAVVAMLFFGVGNDPDREIPENSRVDVTASAQRAQDIAPFPVAVPRLGEDWTPQSARYAADDDPRWMIRYTSPSTKLVTLTQAAEITPTLIQDTLPGAHSEGTAAVGALECDVYTGGDDADARALVCPAAGGGVIVSGKTSQDELAQVASAASAAAQE